MGTFTAQILIGSPHPNHGGITPTHILYLSENDRPAWVLNNENASKDNRGGISKITWIPTIENTLEDAIVMIATHVCKNGKIIEHVKAFSKKTKIDWIEMYSDFDESKRKLLYEECKTIMNFPKLIVSAFRESTIERQLPVLKQYQMDVEVCRVGYSRLFSTWTNETIIDGSLD